MTDAKTWAEVVPNAEIQDIFARLTVQFEDCAALAVEGQHPNLSREEAGKLFLEISETTKRVERCLALVEQYRDGCH